MIDFGGTQIFDTATVDTNILMWLKESNQLKTMACIVKEKVLNNLSDYFRLHSTNSQFISSESWGILSDIEQSIKAKIEAVGTPLKDWDIRINYGIKTGFNDAFIIDGKKKDELIAEDPKSAEIIRPLLRGRDIKRYSYEFADLHLITTFPSLKINIEKYPAVKQYLMSFGYDKLKQTGDIGSRKKTNNKWFETQDSISYWDDFNKPKIVYPNMTKYMPFVYDDNAYCTNQKCFIITGQAIAYLTAFFNSSLFKFCFRDSFPELQGGTREMSKIFFDKIPVMQVTDEMNARFRSAVNDIQNVYSKSKAMAIDSMIFDLYNLSEKERQVIGFVEIE